MRLLVVVRTTAPTLLHLHLHLFLFLLAAASGPVAAATARRQPLLTCRQEIPATLVRDLWSRTNQLIDGLPEEENFSGRWRLLPKFCTKCPEPIGWLETRELIDVYQKHVFGSEVVQKLLPLHYNDLLYRLQYTLHHCVSSSKPSKSIKIIKKMEKKIKKKRRNKVALKAVREFTFVLRWINDLAQHHTL